MKKQKNVTPDARKKPGSENQEDPDVGIISQGF